MASSRLEQELANKMLAKIAALQDAPHPGSSSGCALTAPVVDFAWLCQVKYSLIVYE